MMEIGSRKSFGASSLRNSSNNSSYLFIQWQKPTSNLGSKMPKSTLNHVVKVSVKIYALGTKYTRENIKISMDILCNSMIFSRISNKITSTWYSIYKQVTKREYDDFFYQELWKRACKVRKDRKSCWSLWGWGFWSQKCLKMRKMKAQFCPLLQIVWKITSHLCSIKNISNNVFPTILNLQKSRD